MILTKVHPVLYPLRYAAWVQYKKLQRRSYYLKYKDPEYKKALQARKKAKQANKLKVIRAKHKAFKQILNKHL